MAYITLSELKNLYCIQLPDAKVQVAINSAHMDWLRVTSFKKRFENYSQILNTNEYVFILPENIYISDYNFDWTLAPTDLVAVTQFDTTTLVEQSILSNVTAVSQFMHAGTNRFKVTFDGAYPQTPYTRISVDLYLTPLDISDERFRYFAKEYIELCSFERLLNEADVPLLQTGIANYDLNGVKLSVDSVTIRDVIKDIERRRLALYEKFMPIYISQFKQATDTQSIYFGHRSFNLRN